jgi:two-component system, OmpR family, response regulator
MNPRGAIANPAGAVRRGRAHGDGAPARPLQVYVVEDNVIVLESLVAALEELAPVHVLGTAADESVAVDWLRSGARCDLVIVDIFLRTGSGLGVLAAARQKRPETALVVLSNYANEEMRARCLASGADRVFDKSRDIDQLVAYCLALSTREPGELPH